MNNNEREILVDVKCLSKYFPGKGNRKEVVKAVDNISLQIAKGETLSIVGESGCGKSTLGRTILKLIEPSAGVVYYKGQSLNDVSKKQLREMRKNMQMVFQDPYASLNPRKTVRQMLEEPIIYHKIATSREEVEKKVLRVMDLCGLPNYYIDRYPHEFSGGQRQRICIARALALEPDFVVLDEPVSALDVSIQSQIINLLEDLQKDLGLTYLFISHDLSVVHYISDRVVVMYLGNIMEIADKNDLYEAPLHPYTQALLSAIPKENPAQKKERIILEGEIPSPANPPEGCRFCTRCRYASETCHHRMPKLNEVAPGHFVACDRVKEIEELKKSHK